ncbi:MAG: type I glyceraldehyde-3-phosphate dehydrogenase [Chitinispirillaceae bacterium]
MAKIAINGLGRIGRATLKIIMDNPQLDLIAINDLVSPENLAYLLKYDSAYGQYEKDVRVEANSLMIGDSTIRVLNIKDPAELPWKDMGIDIVIESTGIFTNAEGVQKHLQAGAGYAILSAPPKSDGMPTIVPGVNASGEDDKMFSTASCTTNCITPVFEIMARRIGVSKALMTTVHAYTSSQSIVDGPAKKYRRGRAAALNFVPTTTGAAKATTKVLPDFEGRFDGIAIRGPVPVGSIADLTFLTQKETSVDQINNIFREESKSSRYEGVLGVTEDPLVSSDIIKDPRASIVDLTMTTVVDGDLVKILSWYDNEWGYAAQMVREAAAIARRI